MAVVTRPRRFPIGSGVALEGDLSLPDAADAVVVFAHGSGSSRHSPRNRSVAHDLATRGLGTLLIDLLTPDESEVRRLRFDIDRLTGRLVGIVDQVHAELPDVRIGLFGASTGAAGALAAAARRPQKVVTVVSRGGRPDLAGESLDHVTAPTLLIVGGEDHAVLDLNRAVLGRLPADSSLEVVPGATHLFEEAGALDEVVRLAGDWFQRRLAPTEPRSGWAGGRRTS